ncbi:hypothetical protein WMY93_029158 [Mugilogobius chulae]|uniref:C1q domain-containing protein n=1 Tax=Mugilogobius chulae TaxID=88201 RepID=A0AAW0N1E0_9GOBI
MQTVLVLVLFGAVFGLVHSQEQDQTAVLMDLQTRVQNLETAPAQQQNPHVAFCAALYADTEEGNYGPFNSLTTMVFKNVLTNDGNGYNPATGVFQASVKGMYSFHVRLFSTFSPSPNLRASLKKNTQSLGYILDEASSDTHDSSSLSVIVPLEVGDSVFVELAARKSVYENRGRHNNFCGFLIYPM